MKTSAKISPIKKLAGEISLKGDKSISHRAVIIGSIAEEKTRIKNFLEGEDCLYTLKAFRRLGVNIDSSAGEIVIEGRGLNGLTRPSGEIYLGNSGTSMRLISGVLAGQDFESTLAGDESLSRRPMDRIIEPLRMMGADIKGREDKFAPLAIKGGALRSIAYATRVASAQVKSAIMLAGLYADGITEITEPTKSRDHTERMLSFFGAKMVMDHTKIQIYGRPRLRGSDIVIPGDVSSAAFLITAALFLKGSDLIIKDLLFNRTRMGLVCVLKDMGGSIELENRRFNGYEELCDFVVKPSKLKGVVITEDRIPFLIDEVPILLVAAVFSEGETLIKGAGELRVKETDRINSMVTALRKMGADITAEKDDIKVIGTGRLKGAKMDSYGDHRTAMSLIIAGLCAEGESEIADIDCINTSFPDFFANLEKLSVKK